MLKNKNLLIFLSLTYTTILFLFFISFNINFVNAKNSDSLTSVTSIGERKILVNFTSTPDIIKLGQPSQFKLLLIDEKTGGIIQHVTYRITVNKDNVTKLSNFFHSHSGVLVISFHNHNSRQINTEGTFDMLTNAITPDPSGVIVITGPLFPTPGIYRIDVEIITMDNDKTDLPIPLKFHFNVNVVK